jgi:hypothetical protein
MRTSLRRACGPRVVSFLTLSLLLSAPGTSGAQILNGDFEANPQNGWPLVGAPAFLSPGTWQVTTGSVNVGTAPAGTNCQAGPTSHCVDLNGSNPGAIAQTLQSIAPGHTCTVRFYMSRHRDLASGSATMTASVNGNPTTPASFVHNATGMTVADPKWELRSFSFVTTSATNVLAFASQSPGAAGPQIDNVSIHCQGPLTEGPGHTLTPTLVPVPDPCCPPWNAPTLVDRMAYQSSGGIGAPFTLQFSSTSTLNGQLSAYMAYLHAVDPSHTSIHIDFSLFDAGTGANPGAGAQVGPTSTATWSWTGTSSVPSFFAPGAMQPNRWYTIRTRIYLNDGGGFFPDTCSDVEMSVRIQLRGARAGRGEGAVMQLRSGSGPITERPVQMR